MSAASFLDKENVFAQQSPIAAKSVAGGATPSIRQLSAMAKGKATPLANITNRTPRPMRVNQDILGGGLAKSMMKAKMAGINKGVSIASPLAKSVLSASNQLANNQLVNNLSISKPAISKQAVGKLVASKPVNKLSNTIKSTLQSSTVNALPSVYDEVEYGPPTMQYEATSYWSTQFKCNDVLLLTKLEPSLIYPRQFNPSPLVADIDDALPILDAFSDNVFRDMHIDEGVVVDELPGASKIWFDV